ncbi:MAG: hypothetical protein M3Q82_06240, partial [Actinomycetota bacterium]|nr:hypothetical protein [Actinomycetota bacterium]
PAARRRQQPDGGGPGSCADLAASRLGLRERLEASNPPDAVDVKPVTHDTRPSARRQGQRVGKGRSTTGKGLGKALGKGGRAA